MSYYRNQLEDYLKTIYIRNDKALDIGGASNPVRDRLASWDVIDCVFFDNGAEEPKVGYVPFDLNLPLTQLKGYKEDSFKFNVIFCLEVFEYIWNPAQAIKNIYDLMDTDSFAYVSFPTIYPFHQPEKIDSLRYTKNGVIKLAESVNLEIKDIIARVATKGRSALSDFYIAEGMHPVRNTEEIFDIGYIVKLYKPLE